MKREKFSCYKTNQNYDVDYFFCSFLRSEIILNRLLKEKEKKRFYNIEYVSFGKVTTVNQKKRRREEKKKTDKKLSFVKRAASTTIKKMKRRGGRESVRASSSISFANFLLSLFVPFGLHH